MTETWTLETQYEINPHLFASVGYWAMHATHLHAMLDFMNDMPDKYMALGDWLDMGSRPIYFGADSASTRLNPTPILVAQRAGTWPILTGATNMQPRLCAPSRRFRYINMDSYLQNLGQSTYKRVGSQTGTALPQRLNILASYTFSKTLTDADVIQPYWSTLQNGGAVQDPENLRGEKAVSSEDTPQNFVVSYIYELPVGQGKHFLGTTPKPVMMRSFRIGASAASSTIRAGNRSASLAQPEFRERIPVFALIAWQASR